MPEATARTMYEIDLHYLPTGGFHFDVTAEGDGEDAIGRVLRSRANKIHDRLLDIAAVAEKLVAAGWSLEKNAAAGFTQDHVMRWWRAEDPFRSEGALREHLATIGVPADAAFLQVVTAEEDAEDDDDESAEDESEGAEDLDEEEAGRAPRRKLYLVRWQDLSGALVLAHDEHELLDILDEEADTTGCSWWEYDGPLLLDFTLPIEWQHVNKSEDKDPSPAPEGWVPENIRITKLPEDTNEVTHLDMHLAGSDTASQAKEKIFALAFPRLHEVMHERDTDDQIDEDPPADLIAAAAREEISRTMRAHRQLTQVMARRAAEGDKDAALALMLGTSTEQVQNMNVDNVPPDLPAEQPLPPLVPPPEETGN